MNVNKKRKIVLFLSTLFIISHLFFLFFSPYAYYHEDEKITSLGLEIINGELEVPFWLHLDTPHSGGSIFSALLNIPVYLLFGNNYFSVKLVGLVLSLICFLLILNFNLERYGSEIVIPMGLLFIVCTPSKLIHDFIRIGNTIDLQLVVMLSFLLSYNFFKGKRESFKKALTIGLLTGFALWIQYLSVLFIVTFLVFWYVFDKKFFISKAFRFFIVGNFVGLLPFAFYNLKFNFASFTADPFIVRMFIQTSKPNLLNRINYMYDFFSNKLIKSFCLQGTLLLNAKQTSIIFYFFIISCFIFLVLKERKKILFFLKSFFSFRYCLPQKHFNYNLFLLVFLFLFLLILNILAYPLWGGPGGFGYLDVWAYYYLIFIHPFIYNLLAIGINYFIKFFRKKTFASFFIGGIMLLILLPSYFKLITPKRENLSCLIFGSHKPKCKPLNDNVQIAKGLFFNKFLFSPHVNTYVNAYSTGYNFSYNFNLFKNILKELPKEYFNTYLNGAAESWYLFIKSNSYSMNPKLQNVLNKELFLLSPKQRIQFFSFMLEGGYYENPNREEIYRKVLINTFPENQIYLKQAFRELMNYY